jgi:hypothetical protein
MLEIYEETIDNGYNTIVEKAPSTPKTGMTNFWGEYVIPKNYNVEHDILAVSDLNSLLSTRERYEEQLLSGAKTPKLTEIIRHDDSFIATNMVIAELTASDKSLVFIRGDKITKTPLQVYPDKRFAALSECINYYRDIDTEQTLKEYPERCWILRKQMIERNAPKKQFDQLDEIYERCKSR